MEDAIILERHALLKRLEDLRVENRTLKWGKTPVQRERYEKNLEECNAICVRLNLLKAQMKERNRILNSMDRELSAYIEAARQVMPSEMFARFMERAKDLRAQRATLAPRKSVFARVMDEIRHRR